MGDWRSDAASLPNFAPKEFDVEPRTTGLIVVDMQHVDAHPDHGLGPYLREHYPEVHSYYFTRIRELVEPNCRRLLHEFRQARLRVVHLTVGPILADGMDMVRLRRPNVAPGLTPMLYHVGTKEHAILPGLVPADGEIVINKTTRGAFNSTAIERVLLNLGLETLVVCGVSTSSCVETTARDAADRGFKTVIVEDATAEFDEPSHEATLRQFVVRWGRVLTTDEVIRELDRAAATPASGAAAGV